MAEETPTPTLDELQAELAKLKQVAELGLRLASAWASLGTEKPDVVVVLVTSGVLGDMIAALDALEAETRELR